MSSKYITRLKNSEAGYAAFVITLVTMIVVSLIVIAFSADSRLEQKDALANDLANQAYYAAESGINDAYALVTADISKGITPTATGNNCATLPYISDSSNVLSNGVSYSCLTVNATPDSLLYQDVTPGASQVVELDSSSQTAIKSMTINWQYAGSGTLQFGGCPSSQSPSANLPILNASGSSTTFSPAYCGAGVLQLDMIDGSNLSSNPNASGQTLFLEPQSNTGSASNQTVTPTNQDQVYYVNCSASNPAVSGGYACAETINLNLVAGDIEYLRLASFYQQTNVSIAAHDANGNSLALANAQIVIDSTGKAAGQLKRLEERVCYGQYCSNNAPVGAIQSTECINKQFGVYPGDSDIPSQPGNC